MLRKWLQDKSSGSKPHCLYGQTHSVLDRPNYYHIHIDIYYTLHFSIQKSTTIHLFFLCKRSAQCAYNYIRTCACIASLSYISISQLLCSSFSIFASPSPITFSVLLSRSNNPNSIFVAVLKKTASRRHTFSRLHVFRQIFAECSSSSRKKKERRAALRLRSRRTNVASQTRSERPSSTPFKVGQFFHRLFLCYFFSSLESSRASTVTSLERGEGFRGLVVNLKSQDGGGVVGSTQKGTQERI